MVTMKQSIPIHPSDFLRTYIYIHHSLSIARIFGDFPPIFFNAYHEKIPPAEPVEEYDTRSALYEVFHYLNHAVLFGVSMFPIFIRTFELIILFYRYVSSTQGSYASMARQKMGIVIRYVLHDKKVAPL